MPPCGTLPQPARRRFPPVPSWPPPASPPRPAALGVAAATGEAAGRWPQPPRGEAGGSRGGREGGREERRKGWGRGAERAHALLMAGAEGAAGGARQVTGREGMGGGGGRRCPSQRGVDRSPVLPRCLGHLGCPFPVEPVPLCVCYPGCPRITSGVRPLWSQGR